MNITEILTVEPKISDLIDFSKIMTKGMKLHEKERYWYMTLKPMMSKLVGFGASKPELSTTEVYDTVYGYFIKLLKI